MIQVTTIDDKIPFRTPLLTARGFIFAGIVLLAPLLGIAVNRPFQDTVFIALSLLAIILLCFLLDFFAVSKFVSKLEVCAKAPFRAYSGDIITLAIEFKIPSSSRKLFFVVHPETPHGCISEIEDYSIKNLNLELQHQLKLLSRGEIIFSRVWLRIIAPSRLTFIEYELLFKKPLVTQVLASPFAQESKKEFVFRAQPFGQKNAREWGSEGREFDRLRPYSAGDDLRRVDWKRSAKRGSLVVRVYRPETHQRVVILLDCSRRMGNLVDKRLQLDYAADASAALSWQALENRDEVGLFAFNHRAVVEIPCAGGVYQKERLIQALSDLRAANLEPDYDLVKIWGRSNRRRSLLVLLTSVVNPASVDNIRAAVEPLARNHLPLVAIIRDVELEKFADLPAKNTRDAYVRAAAYEQINGLKERLDILQRYKVECLLCSPKDLNIRLTKKYEELKLKGKI